MVAPQNRPAGTGRALGSCRWFLLPARGGIPSGGRSRVARRHASVCGRCRESGRPEQGRTAPVLRAGWRIGRPASLGRWGKAAVSRFATLGGSTEWTEVRPWSGAVQSAEMMVAIAT